jgi:hypothetical protein
MRSLLLATKTRIQDFLGLAADSTRDSVCDITEDGAPKPNSGQAFYGIVGNEFGNQSTTSLDEEYRIKVVITLRAGYSPDDKVGTEILTKATTGLWARVEALRAHLHMNETLRADANTNATYGCNPIGTENGFVQPLRFSGARYIGAKGPDWFSAEGQDDAVTGVAAELSFDFARRVQVIEDHS